MPANLPPQYFEAEKEYRLAKEPEDKIKAINKMLMIMPKHKGTDKLKADLRRKIAKLKEESKHKKALQKRAASITVEKEGAAQIALAGLPNVGKSALISSLTNAKPQVADYPYTTRLPIPGMLQFENLSFQLVDLPPIISDFAYAWLPNILRKADCLLIVLDGSVAPDMEWDEINQLLSHWKINLINKSRTNLKEEPFVNKKGVILCNKIDLEESLKNFLSLQNSLGDEYIILPTSAINGRGIEKIGETVFKELEIIRIYTKTAGKKPNYNSPFVLPKGSTVEDLAYGIHKHIPDLLMYARIWGSTRFPGQRVQRDYVLQDNDVVELKLNK